MSQSGNLCKLHITFAARYGDDMKPDDFSGKNIGFLTVIEIAGSDNGAVWKCKCDCGNTLLRKASALKKAIENGYLNTSCGCRKGGECLEKTEAIKNGEKFYFTGKPCKLGHIEKRRVNGNACVECSRLKDLETRASRIQYHMDYQRGRKEKTKEIQDRYREKNREKIRLYGKERRGLEYVKKQRAEHERARNINKRAAGGSVRKKDIDNLLKNQKSMCAHCHCKVKDFHVDHVMPIMLGGSSDIGNLQILCASCNMKKGSKDPIIWANEHGKLL